MNVILIGFMATGKSTIARALGRRLDAPCLDMDRELRRQFGLTIPEVFAQHGEPAFRAAETALLAKLLEESQLPSSCPREFPRRFVLSTGGGTPLRPENQPLLKQLGHVVWLRARVETIAGRCRPHIARRPLLHGHESNLAGHIAELLQQREATYRVLADSEFWTDDHEVTPDEVARRIKAVIYQHMHAPQTGHECKR